MRLLRFNGEINGRAGLPVTSTEPGCVRRSVPPTHVGAGAELHDVVGPRHRLLDAPMRGRAAFIRYLAIERTAAGLIEDASNRLV